MELEEPLQSRTEEGRRKKRAESSRRTDGRTARARNERGLQCVVAGRDGSGWSAG